MELEIRHARLVAAIANTGSISKAAALLSLPQPGATAQLKRIEKALGGPLFSRSWRGVVPTPRGERLIPMLVELVDHAEAVLAEASFSPPKVLKVGYTDWAPVTLREHVWSALPAFEVRTETVKPEEGIAAVRDGLLSLLLLLGDEVTAAARALEPNLLQEIVMHQRIYVALPADHKLARCRVLDLAAASGLPWVRHAREHWLSRVEDQLFTDVGAEEPTVLHQVGGQAEAMSWVRQAGAVALATSAASAEGISLVELTDVPRGRLDVVWNPEEVQLSTCRMFIEAVREHYRGCLPDQRDP